MSLTQRLLLWSLAVGGLLVVLVVALATGRLETRLVDAAARDLELHARTLAVHWTPASNPDSLADAWGIALGSRVTLLTAEGAVIGDSEYDGSALAQLGSLASREEIVAARQGQSGSARRESAAAGIEHLYVAVRVPQGIVRIAQPTRELDTILGGARIDVLLGGLIALAVAMLLSALFVRAVSRPIVELRDVAQAFAAGDVSRRPTLVAPGEIGDLATALYRMAGQLGARLEALEREEGLLRALTES